MAGEIRNSTPEAEQAAFLPKAPAGGALFVWRPDSTDRQPDEVELSLAGQSLRARGRRLGVTAAIRVLSSARPSDSASVFGYASLLRVARLLLQRGSLRPGVEEGRSDGLVGWTAILDADERAVLADIVARMPPVAFAGAADPRAAWSIARAFVDAALDALVREAAPTAELPISTWEGTAERALVAREPRPASATWQRVRQALGQWQRSLNERDKPRVRLVLHLDPPTSPGAPFPLSFLVEVRDSAAGILGPLPATDVWSGRPDAHRLADDLQPVRTSLRDALQRVGRVVAPVEASLAGDAPAGARLSPTEAWELLVRHRTEIEAAGVRIATAPVLDGISQRFPRAQVELRRADGASPESATLAPRYRATWRVTTDSVSFTPDELRAGGRAAPLANLRGLWVPLTAEAAERLAKVVERGEVEWTGTQALAAALAGEVRLPGDLSDAKVVPESGLASLLAELQADARELESPPGLKAQLRHYQSMGMAWLFHRTRLGLGALLADDMGLGKTVQLISLLLMLRARSDPEPGEGPTLIVCPASVVGNWERELARFAPDLKVVRHHGDARHRDAAELTAEAGPHDVVLTTYSLARRDAVLLAGVKWGTVVLDEAQNIKNPTAAQARAIRELPARRRVALSGTPVENRLTELWGLLEFLNPGLLGPLDKFRREIANPIERDRDARAARWLRAATSPFILRRLKSDPNIAPELPEKEIIRVYCSLTEEQAELYKAAAENSLKALDSLKGIERSGQVLKLLTELKQICNHPAHFLGDSNPLTGRSGKLERAVEMLDEIVDSGERALVFTQYVEMGTRLCSHLAERLKIEVPFFHGGLNLAAREQMVQRFQQENGPPILVLSLRAGGVGLNLTRASHVMHFDRWWNPAVENQATDRAHRIGQTRRVQVHHLITLGTLEEKIDQMLEDKLSLADAVVGGGESWITGLSTDELRALVSLGSDAAVESSEAWDKKED